MEDILRSIKAFMYDRASSPLMGAFVLSWVAWNYRIIVILISSEPYVAKFKSIDDYISDHVFVIPWTEFSTYFYVGHGLLFPLGTALAYIFAYPLVAKPVLEYSLEQQQAMLTLKKESNESQIITEADKIELLRTMAKADKLHDEAVVEHQQKIAGITALAEDRRVELTQKKEAYSKNTSSHNKQLADLKTMVEEKTAELAKVNEDHIDVAESHQKKVAHLSASLDGRMNEIEILRTGAIKISREKSSSPKDLSDEEVKTMYYERFPSLSTVRDSAETWPEVDVGLSNSDISILKKISEEYIGQAFTRLQLNSRLPKAMPSGVQKSLNRLVEIGYVQDLSNLNDRSTTYVIDSSGVELLVRLGYIEK